MTPRLVVPRPVLAAALVLLVGARLGCQSPTGAADADSAAVARGAWRRGQLALRSQDTATAAREIAHAAAAWPTQPVYLLGNAMAFGMAGDTTAVLRELERYADLGLGADLRADTVLARYAARPEFAAIVARHARNLAPLVRSRVVATLPDPDSWPEGLGHDARTGRWYVASVRHRTIVELGPRGAARELFRRAQPGIGAVLAVRPDPRDGTLWATTSGITQMSGYTPADSAIAALVHLRARDGAILRRWDLPVVAGGHVLGDVAVASTGDVWFSDSNEPVLYRLRRGAASPERTTSPHFRSLQGIAPTPDGRVVYVADYSLGIMRVDVASGAVTRVADAPGTTSLGCDGLAWHRGSIVAVQNGVAPARIMRFTLDASGTRFTGAALLDRNSAVADEPTIGVMVGSEFVYVANSQWEKRGSDGAAKGEMVRGVLLGVVVP